MKLFLALSLFTVSLAAQAVTVTDLRLNFAQDSLIVDVQFTGCPTDEFTMSDNRTDSSALATELLPLNPVPCESPTTLIRQLTFNLDAHQLRSGNSAAPTILSLNGVSVTLPVRPALALAPATKVLCQTSLSQVAGTDPDGEVVLTYEALAVYEIPLHECGRTVRALSFAEGSEARYNQVSCFRSTEKVYIELSNGARGLSREAVSAQSQLITAFPLSSDSLAEVRCRLK